MVVCVDIIIPKMVKPKDLAEFFRKVYSEYKGKAFVPTEMEVAGQDFEGYASIAIINNDFTKLRDYADKGLTVVTLNSGLTTWLRIYYPPDAYGYPTINVGPRFLYPETEEEVPVARENLEDMLSFAKILMKHAGASYFYGGLDTIGEITDKGNVDVELIYCKGKEYVRMLQVHFQNRFGALLPESQIERIVRETATVQEEDGFTTVYFFKIKLQSESGALFEQQHYAMVKRLLEK